MPPSLNKYLYAYQNPTVYVDPDGRFPVLEGITDELGRWREQAIDTADGLERNGLNVFPSMAMGLGGGLLGALEFGAGVLNLAGDLALSPLASADSPSFFLRESARSLAETRQTVTDTIETVVENPKAVGLAVIDAATRTVGGFAEGDPRATARMFQGVFDAALGGRIGVSASKMVGQTTGAGRRVGHVVTKRRGGAVIGRMDNPIALDGCRRENTLCWIICRSWRSAKKLLSAYVDAASSDAQRYAGSRFV